MFVKGVSGVGPSAIQEKINDISKKSSASNSNVTDEFKTFVKSQMKVEMDVVDALIASFLYEPGKVDISKRIENVERNEENATNTTTVYIHEPPQNYRFPRYISSFAQENDVYDGPSLCTCNGFNGNGSHCFMEVEGTHKCSQCSSIFCKTCVFVPSKDIPKRKNSKYSMPIYYKDGCNEELCLDCFWSSRLSGERGEQIVSSSQNEVSMDEMRQVLNNRVGLQLNIQDITAVEVMELYEMYVSSQYNTQDNIHARSASEKIKYPLFPSEHIYGSNKLKRVGEKFPLSSGGRFISDKQTFSNDQVPLILELLSSLLKYDEELNPKNLDENTYIGEYEFLPTMFLHLAHFSRVDSGFRLLDRCARHTMDPKCKSIYYQDIEFFECNVNGEKGMFEQSRNLPGTWYVLNHLIFNSNTIHTLFSFSIRTWYAFMQQNPCFNEARGI